MALDSLPKKNLGQCLLAFDFLTLLVVLARKIAMRGLESE